MSRQKKEEKYIHIRCDDELYAHLGYLAKKAQMSRSALVRTLIYHGSAERHTNYSTEDARKLQSTLCDISNSMAYISYNAKLKLGVDEGEFLQLESLFRALLRAFDDHVMGLSKSPYYWK